MAGRTAWRVDDVVAYEAMRESATALAALLLRTTNDKPAQRPSAATEVGRLRSDVLNVDPYDRAAVAALALRIRDQIVVLAESAP